MAREEKYQKSQRSIEKKGLQSLLWFKGHNWWKKLSKARAPCLQFSFYLPSIPEEKKVKISGFDLYMSFWNENCKIEIEEKPEKSSWMENKQGHQSHEKKDEQAIVEELSLSPPGDCNAG